jgi:hypothetical protein
VSFRVVWFGRDGIKTSAALQIEIDLFVELNSNRRNLKGAHHEHNRWNLRVGFVAIDREPR